jgi:hypothetical protein
LLGNALHWGLTSFHGHLPAQSGKSYAEAERFGIFFGKIGRVKCRSADAALLRIGIEQSATIPRALMHIATACSPPAFFRKYHACCD